MAWRVYLYESLMLAFADACEWESAAFYRQRMFAELKRLPLSHHLRSDV